MPGRLPRVTAEQMLRALRRDGWLVDDQEGSHIALRNSRKPGYVTVPYHRGRTLKLKTLTSTLRQARLAVDES
jgi:predicted RNA binding protein YcfA (HicA-like mRNA interferase family)